MIGIRADGNNQIGIGHIMRCLTIAEALREQGENVIFLVADDACVQLIQMRDFEFYILDTSYDDMDAEIDILAGVADALHLDKLLIDSYYVTKKYLSEVQKKVVTCYLDDVESFEYPVDVIINYNVFAKEEAYSYLDGKGRILTGPAYAPVRREFAECRSVKQHPVKDILITMGGSDAYNLSCQIAEMLLQNTDYRIHVVCGPFNRFVNELKSLAKKDDKLTIHENVSKMWELMSRCDMAISAAGSTMYELAVTGIPTVTFSFVENQIKIAEEFGRRKAALTAGHYVPERKAEFVQAVVELAVSLAENTESRIDIAQKASGLVDGKGASRIAQEIIAYQR